MTEPEELTFGGFSYKGRPTSSETPRLPRVVPIEELSGDEEEAADDFVDIAMSYFNFSTHVRFVETCL